MISWSFFFVFFFFQAEDGIRDRDVTGVQTCALPISEGFVAFACPVGPKGLGYLAVLNGLAIPKTAPNPEDSKKLITYLTDPKTAAITAREVGFFPPTKAQQLPADADEGIKAEAAALASQAGNPK